VPDWKYPISQAQRHASASAGWPAVTNLLFAGFELAEQGRQKLSALFEHCERKNPVPHREDEQGTHRLPFLKNPAVQESQIGTSLDHIPDTRHWLVTLPSG
jgi:hypothetical protein